MNSWTLCLLTLSFVPIPRVPTTLVPCGGFRAVVQSASLPKEQNLGPSTSAEVGRARKSKNLSVRVMDRLQQAEAHESNLHYKQDIRQAWITTSLAQKNVPEPFVEASYACFGCHPDKVFPRWLEEQRAKLGPEFYLFYNDEGVLRPNLPTIPPRNADTHAANEADSANWDGSVGLVPTKQEVV